MFITAFSFYKFKRNVQLYIVLPIIIISVFEFIFFYKPESDNKWMYLSLVLFFIIYGLLRFINGLITFITKQYFATKTRFKVSEIRDLLDRKVKDKKYYLEFKGKVAIVFAFLDIVISFVCFYALFIILSHIF